MPAVNQSPRDAAMLLSESNGALSREVVTIASGQNLQAGTVLGKVTASGEYAQVNPAANDGSEVAAAVLLYEADASSGALQATALVRLAEVAKDKLIWPAGIAQADLDTALGQLAGAFIIAR